ncbi:hypothetical protein CcCBS67573_g01193 [Chytriomyces confervae]|uniref:Uncharacterized protein n=1 Tax=Chytriomyces confervae TaxID=246404 RepID=A0A507FMC3_9FUNG|nr:hypothetical protein CcCBS67573_g01193 [Chytriomyces confervae]
MISDSQLDDSRKKGSCILTLADGAPEPDSVSGHNRGSLSNSSASISHVFRNGLQNLKRTSIGIFGVSLRMRKEVHIETIEEVLANRYAKSQEIGAMDVLKKTEHDFQAEMAAFVQIINEHCKPTENIVQLLELVACMQQTSGVISESHSNIKSEWPWKNTTAIYNRFFGLMTAFTKPESELFFRSKKSGLRLEAALLQRMNDYLYKILERPIWLQFKQTASQEIACKNSEYLEYALTQIAALVSDVLELAGVDSSFDGYNDMVSLEKKMDSSKCLGLETDPYAKVILDKQQQGKKRGGRAALGDPLTIFCAGDFILIGREEDAAAPGNGGVSRLRYIPVALKSVIARQYDMYGSLENVIEMNLCNSVLIAVQTHGADDRELLANFLNSASKQQNGAPSTTPSFWLVDKPPVETGAVLYVEPAQTEVTKPRIDVFQCLCYPHISKAGSWEKLAKCELLIVTEWDGTNPRIVVSLDGTKRPIAVMDLHVDMEMRLSGTRGVTLLMKALNTGNFGPYMINVKDTKMRDELVQSVDNIKFNLAASNFNAMTDKLMLKNIPDYIQLCPDLEATTLWFECNVNVKITTEGGSKIHQLGLSKLCLKTLESPVGPFKIATLLSESDANHVYLDSIITSDMLVQDCRTPSCALIKIAFASKPGVEYNLEFVSDKPKESVFSRSAPTTTKNKIVLHTIVSELILSTLRKDTPAHESVFRAPEPVPSDPPIIHTAPLATSETAANTPCPLPTKTQSTSQNTSTVTAKKAGPRVGGWVASQVRFFNGLAQRSVTPAASDSTDVKAKAPRKKLYLSAKSSSNFSLKEAALPSTSAPASVPVSASASSSSLPLSASSSVTLSASASASAPAVQTSSIKSTVREAEKWVKHFSEHQKAEKDDGRIILPPNGSPVELLSCWLFIPRVAKQIITSAGGPYNEMLFFAAVAFLEIDTKRKLNLAGDAF